MLAALINPLAFIVTLGLLVTVHEYGHFQMAKWCGIKVLKFSIGFGKPLLSKQFGKDQTEFVLAAIPLGGYVKMLDEREIDTSALAVPGYSNADLKRAFNRQSVIKRILVVLAGPAANLILAILLYWVVLLMGVVGMKPILGEILANSPAAIANFAKGDILQKINGKNVTHWQDARWLLLNASLKNKIVEVSTINASNEVHVHPLDLSRVDYEDSNRDILDVVGFTLFQPDLPPRIGETIKGSAADRAGLKTNDLVMAINNKSIKHWEELVQIVKLHPNEPLNFLILRSHLNLKLTVIPQVIIENNKRVGRIGATFKIDQRLSDSLFVTTHYTVFGALLKATQKTWETAVFSLKMIVNMLTGEASWKSMSGPVTIASYAGQTANMGFIVFIGFLALVSISIGVLNLLPIPVLDGGHLMYYMVEIFTGKPVSELTMAIGQKIGFVLLGLMMTVAFYNDINRLITG